MFFSASTEKQSDVVGKRTVQFHDLQATKALCVLQVELKKFEGTHEVLLFMTETHSGPACDESIIFSRLRDHPKKAGKLF